MGNLSDDQKIVFDFSNDSANFIQNLPGNKRVGFLILQSDQSIMSLALGLSKAHNDVTKIYAYELFAVAPFELLQLQPLFFCL